MATLNASLIMSLVDKISAPSRAIAATVTRLQSSLANNAAQMSAVRGQMVDAAAVGYVLARSLAAPITAAADYEAIMNRVAAATGATGEELQRMDDAARHAGRTTQFTATQSGEAVEMLAKNGLSAAQIYGGALNASLLLAASSGSDIASAGDLATDVMMNFGLAAGDLMPVVDGITGVLLASKFGIDDYRLAMAQAGGVAGPLGVSLADFNAVIAATSSAFASGSDAGTSYKTFLQRLVPASGPAADAMKKLGLEFFDSQGNMKSMAEISQELQDGLAGLSDEARNDALSTIFGTDAIRTALLLAEQGAEGIERLHDVIGDASAQQQADARMKGFNGALKEFQSISEDLAISVGNALLPALTSALKTIGPFVTKMAQFAEANPQLTAAVIAATSGLVALRVAAIAARFSFLWLKGGALTAALGMTKLAGGLLGLLNPLRLVTNAMRLLKVAVIGTGIGAVLVGLALAGTWIHNNWKGLGEMFTAFGSAFTAAVEPVAPIVRPIITAVGTLFGWMKNLTGELEGGKWTTWGTTAGTAVGTFVTGAVQNVQTLINKLVGIPGELTTLATDIAAVFTGIDYVGIGSKMITDLWEGIKSVFGGMSEWVQAEIAKMFALATNPAAWFGGGEAAPTQTAPSGREFPTGIEQRAKGGHVNRGQTYLVGEQGPEFVTPSRSGFVHPNGVIPRAPSVPSYGRGSGAAVNQTFNINVAVDRPNASASEIASAVSSRMASDWRGNFSQGNAV